MTTYDPNGMNLTNYDPVAITYDWPHWDTPGHDFEMCKVCTLTHHETVICWIMGSYPIMKKVNGKQGFAARNQDLTLGNEPGFCAGGIEVAVCMATLTYSAGLAKKQNREWYNDQGTLEWYQQQVLGFQGHSWGHKTKFSGISADAQPPLKAREPYVRPAVARSPAVARATVPRSPVARSAPSAVARAAPSPAPGQVTVVPEPAAPGSVPEVPAVASAVPATKKGVFVVKGPRTLVLPVVLPVCPAARTQMENDFPTLKREQYLPQGKTVPAMAMLPRAPVAVLPASCVPALAVVAPPAVARPAAAPPAGNKHNVAVVPRAAARPASPVCPVLLSAPRRISTFRPPATRLRDPFAPGSSHAPTSSRTPTQAPPRAPSAFTHRRDSGEILFSSNPFACLVNKQADAAPRKAVSRRVPPVDLTHRPDEVIAKVAWAPRHKKNKGKIIGKNLLKKDNFALAASGFMVPTKPGPCIASVEALHVLPHFATTIELAKNCIAKKIANVYFGLTWVKRFGKHKLFRLHMQTTPGVHFTQLTKSTLPKLNSLISTWGEAQGKKKSKDVTIPLINNTRTPRPLMQQLSATQPGSMTEEKNYGGMFAMPNAVTQPSRIIPVVLYEHLTQDEKDKYDQWQEANPVTEDYEVEEDPLHPQPPRIMSWYKNDGTSMNIPFEHLRFFKKYRNVHEANVEKMFGMYTRGEYLPAHSLTVRVVKEHPNIYEIVDGLHRFFAMQRIRQTFGLAKLGSMIGSGDECLVNCTVLKHDTPRHVLTMIAESQNEADAEHQAMTWVDSLVNLHQFVIATAPFYEKRHWSELTHQEIFTRGEIVKHSAMRSYSEMQKKMGLVQALFTRADEEALNANPLAYHKSTTIRTAAMEIMIMDSMTREALTRLTTQYVKDREDNYILDIMNWNEETFVMWTLATMYPLVYTTNNSRKLGPQRYEDFMQDKYLVKVANIMRTRLLLGASLTKRLTPAACAEMRSMVGHYVLGAGAIELYGKMLEIAEPSGTLLDSPIFQAAQFAENIGVDEELEEKQSPAIAIMVRGNEWPFTGHAGYKIDQAECTDKCLETTQATQSKKHHATRAEGEMPRLIAVADLKTMAGMHVQLDKCECGAPCNSYCAIHQIATCPKCVHYNECSRDWDAVWHMNDQAGDDAKARDNEAVRQGKTANNVKNYSRHIRTIALLQVIAPNKNNVEALMKDFSDIFGDASNASNAQRDTDSALKDGAAKLSAVLLCNSCVNDNKRANAESFCSACGQLCCKTHAGFHKRTTCFVVHLHELGLAWRTLQLRTLYKSADLFKDWDKIDKGSPIAHDNSNCTTIQELDLVLTKLISLMPKDFHIGKDAVRRKYNYMKEQQRKEAAEKEAPATITTKVTRSEQQMQAISMLRRWDTASDEKERAFCMQACKSIVLGEDCQLEEKIHTMASARKAGNGKTAASGCVAVDKLDEFQKKEMLQLRKVYFENKWADRIVLLNKDCYTLTLDNLPEASDDGNVFAGSLFRLDRSAAGRACCRHARISRQVF